MKNEQPQSTLTARNSCWPKWNNSIPPQQHHLVGQLARVESASALQAKINTLPWQFVGIVVVVILVVLVNSITPTQNDYSTTIAAAAAAAQESGHNLYLCALVA